MFTLYEDWRSEDPFDIACEIERMLAAHREYRSYLERERPRFPTSAFELASAEWRNNFNDHRAPHDSWVAEVRFIDRSLPESGGNRLCDIALVLFGAYHDGHLHLVYREVQSFKFSSYSVSDGPTQIYRDEIRLSDAGHVLHEIEFLGADNWLIECRDIEWDWVPLDQQPADEV